MKRLLILVISVVAIAGCSSDRQPGEYDFKKLNRQAAEEYLVPVRPGDAGANPFWNEFALKFIYAPSFAVKALVFIHNMKDEALADQIVIVQDRLTGWIPTCWQISYDSRESNRIWVNCSYFCVKTMLKFAEILEP